MTGSSILFACSLRALLTANVVSGHDESKPCQCNAELHMCGKPCDLKSCAETCARPHNVKHEQHQCYIPMCPSRCEVPGCNNKCQ
jgi:hypothetical protein